MNETVDVWLIFTTWLLMSWSHLSLIKKNDIVQHTEHVHVDNLFDE